MKNLRNNFNTLRINRSAKFIQSITFKSMLLFSVILLLSTGCKKDKATTTDRDYGYAKLTVECAGKCHISYGTGTTLSEIDVDKSQAVYYIRYQRNYDLILNVTPIDVDQNVIINVYSREEKQIFRNSAVKKVGETWTTKVLIP
ncbi:hypothetical protein IDJ77_04595 [Mucilaginibacter sp. ZT4R22]|uniref:Lipoprotein n=1 Tax=Mucilaginibacter pankratovii TaxID=2772110 RepID=A0ABR7WNL2_9SPHI|nr:hypothetical protein [Mucilaginibacter pankratovii]MBD1363082.1 hypothetical protein [Mucilaginibacter pankratovii]